VLEWEAWAVARHAKQTALLMVRPGGGAGMGGRAIKRFARLGRRISSRTPGGRGKHGVAACGIRLEGVTSVAKQLRRRRRLYPYQVTRRLSKTAGDGTG
jgi:hypothetical protein